MLKISSQGVSNLEKTKGQYFLSKESYFFTLCKLGGSDSAEPDWGASRLWPWGRGPGAGLALPLLPGAGSSRGLLAMDIHPPPMHASGPPPRGLHFHGKGTPRGSGGRGPQPRCSRVGRLLVGVAGEVEGLDHINILSFTLLLCVFFPLLKGISWFLKHSVGDILVKMQYFYVM